jgi:hypothetical protein
MFLDEKKTVIGNKRYDLRRSKFMIPSCLLNKNKNFQKGVWDDLQTHKQMSESDAPKIDSDNNLNINNILKAIDNTSMQDEKKDFLQILSKNEIKIKARNRIWSNFRNKLEKNSNEFFKKDTIDNNLLSLQNNGGYLEDIQNERNNFQNFLNKKRGIDYSFDRNENNNKNLLNPDFISEEKNITSFDSKNNLFQNYKNNNYENQNISNLNFNYSLKFPTINSSVFNYNINSSNDYSKLNNITNISNYSQSFNNNNFIQLQTQNNELHYLPSNTHYKFPNNNYSLEDGEVEENMYVGKHPSNNNMKLNTFYRPTLISSEFSEKLSDFSFEKNGFPKNLQNNKSFISEECNEKNRQYSLNSYKSAQDLVLEKTNEDQQKLKNISKQNAALKITNESLNNLKNENIKQVNLLTEKSYFNKDHLSGSKIMKNEEEKEKAPVTKIDLYSTKIKLKQLIEGSKTGQYIKLMTNDFVFKSDFFVVNKNSFSSSSLKIKYILTNQEFINTNACVGAILENQIVAKFEDVCNTTSKCLENFNRDHVALVQEIQYFYVIVGSKNHEIISSLNCDSHIDDNRSTLLILKILEQDKVQSINNFIQNNLKLLIERMTIFLICNVQKVKKSDTNNEDISINLDSYNVMKKELENLRELNYKNKACLEEALKKKEDETKSRYKVFYEKQFEIEVKKYSQDQQEILNEVNIANTNLKKINKQLESQFKEITGKYMIDREQLIESQKENRELKKYRLSYEELLKQNKNIMKQKSELELEIEKLKIILKNKEDEQKKLLENKKDNSSQNLECVKNQTLRFDEFVIQECPDEEIETTEQLAEIDSNFIQKIAEEKLCIICCSNLRNCCYMNCGHIVSCFDCTFNMFNSGNNLKKKAKDVQSIKGKIACLICKKENKQAIKVYFT